LPVVVVDDVEPGAGVGVGRDIGPRAAGAAGVGLVGRLGVVGVAARAGAAPGRLAEAAGRRRGAGTGGQRGAAGGGHAGQRRRIGIDGGVEVAVVVGGRDHAGVGEGVGFFERARGAVRPAVGDLLGPQRGALDIGLVHVAEGGAVGLDEQD